MWLTMACSPGASFSASAASHGGSSPASIASRVSAFFADGALPVSSFSAFSPAVADSAIAAPVSRPGRFFCLLVLLTCGFLCYWNVFRLFLPRMRIRRLSRHACIRVFPRGLPCRFAVPVQLDG